MSRPSLNLIKQVVAAYYNLEVRQLESKSMKRSVSIPRQIVMYLGKELGYSKAFIGQRLKRDGSTIYTGWMGVYNKMLVSQDFATEVQLIRNKIEQVHSQNFHRQLTDAEKTRLAHLKEQATLFGDILDKLPPGRETSIAKTKLEEAVMWAVKGITD